MMADRLKSVDLELDLNEETKEEHAPVKVEITGEPAHPETFDYKRTITNFIEMERLKLITYAVAAGIDEAAVDKLLEEENIPDYDLENLKSRLGIKKEKKARVAKPIN